MDNMLKNILSRLLTEEVENQLRWAENDKKLGLNTEMLNESISRRQKVIEVIKQFAHDNNIDLY